MARQPAKKKEEAKATAPVPVKREERHPLTDLRDEMDRLFDSFFHRFPTFPMGRDLFDWDPFPSLGRGLAVRAPVVDVTETEKGYEVVAEMPGMEEKDVNVELKDDVLTVSGEKTEVMPTA